MSILQVAILMTECHMKEVTVTTQPFHTLIEFVSESSGVKWWTTWTNVKPGNMGD